MRLSMVSFVPVLLMWLILSIVLKYPVYRPMPGFSDPALKQSSLQGSVLPEQPVHTDKKYSDANHIIFF